MPAVTAGRVAGNSDRHWLGSWTTVRRWQITASPRSGPAHPEPRRADHATTNAVRDHTGLIVQQLPHHDPVGTLSLQTLPWNGHRGGLPIVSASVQATRTLPFYSRAQRSVLVGYIQGTRAG